MANTKSAKKATRKIERRTAVNRARRSRMRTYVRKVEEALRAGDQAGLDPRRTARCRSPQHRLAQSVAPVESHQGDDSLITACRLPDASDPMIVPK